METWGALLRPSCSSTRDNKPLIEVSFIEVHAGAGGAEALAWADDLARLIAAYHDRSSFLFFPLYQRRTAEGLVEAVYLSEGATAYERLRFLDGVHRRVRTPPGASRRHAAFAAAQITLFPHGLPFDPSEIELELSPEGPQRVHARDPKSGLSVTLHEPRAEARLRNLALNLLATRVERAAQPAQAEGLSLTLDPHVEFKDLRTGFTYADTAGLAEGDLSEMCQAFLRKFD